jgi:hypothetical protein
MDACAIGTDTIVFRSIDRQIGANSKFFSFFEIWPPGGGFAV